MGANAVTTVPVYVAGEVLTAADLNITNSGIPVFADSTARDNSFGGTGEKTLAEGQYAYLESTNATQVYDGAAWQVVGASGLTLIKTQTIGSAVSSVEVTDAFSATYDAYKIIVTGGASSANDRLEMILGATATGYSMQLIYGTYSNSVVAAGSTNQTKWLYAGGTSTTSISMDLDLLNPYLTEFTFINAKNMESAIAGVSSGYLNNSTSYTGFTINPKTGTITGGTIRVYGYANS